jgi:2-polyprenyl-3-methyl-5-hydroxy-6-metoxy-1,4-benzoquinol methylase
MSNVPAKERFGEAYAGAAPWDIGKPQMPFIEAASRVTGSILDSGCGTGDTSLFFAEREHKVTGIDFLPEPIERAKRKAAKTHLSATFEVKDALSLKD